MKESEYSWTVKLDWLNILNLLQIDSIKQISEAKREKAIKKITKTFGKETLLELEPSELDNLVVDELRESMKKELAIYERRKKRMEQEIRNKVIPFKQGGIIKIDPRDLKDLNIDLSEGYRSRLKHKDDELNDLQKQIEDCKES